MRVREREREREREKGKEMGGEREEGGRRVKFTFYNGKNKAYHLL